MKVKKHMEKTKIKRVHKRKRKITTKEKIFAGLGLASNLLGGGGGVAAQKSNTRIVAKNTHASENSLVNKIFGIKTAHASLNVQTVAADSAFLGIDEMLSRYAPDGDSTELFTSLGTYFQDSRNIPSVFSQNSFAAYILGLQGLESSGQVGSLRFSGGQWINTLVASSFITQNPQNVGLVSEQPFSNLPPVGAGYENYENENQNNGGSPAAANNPGAETVNTDLPETFSFTDAYRVLGLPNNYALTGGGGVPAGIYTQDTYYQIQSDYTYKKTASGSQAKSLITSGGISVGTIYIAKKYGVSGLFGKIMGIFKGKAATAGANVSVSGEVLPEAGKIMTSNGVQMDLGDAIDLVQNYPNDAYSVGLNNGMQSEIDTPTGARMSLEDAARRSTQPIIAQSFGLVGIAPAVVGGVAIGVAGAGAGTGVGVGLTEVVTSTFAPLGAGTPIGGTIALVPGALPGTLTPIAGGAAIYTPTAGGLFTTGAGAAPTISAVDFGGASASSTSIFSTIAGTVKGAVAAVGHAITSAGTWVGELVGVSASGGITIIIGAIVGAIIGIRAILTRGQDKIRDSRRIEEVNPYIFQIVDTYNSNAGNTIEEEIILHAEAENAVMQLYQSAAAKFERSQSQASQSLYINAYLHGGNVPGPNYEQDHQMVSIAGMDATFNQRMETHRRNLEFDVYEAADGTREAYPPPGSERGASWGKVTVKTDAQGNITSAVSETGQMIPISILTSILAADGDRLHRANTNPDSGATQTLMLTSEYALTARVGENYNHQIGFTGGVGPFVWELASGSLPSGLSFDSTTGRITGVPTQEGQQDINIKITDSLGHTHIQQFTIFVEAGEDVGVGAAELNITYPQLVSGTVGQMYQAVQINVTGGSGPYGFTIPSGSLPSGLVMSPEGIISGTPTQSGVFTFSIEVTDSAGAIKRLDNISIAIAQGQTQTPPVVGTAVAVPNAQGDRKSVV